MMLFLVNFVPPRVITGSVKGLAGFDAVPEIYYSNKVVYNLKINQKSKTLGQGRQKSCAKDS